MIVFPEKCTVCGYTLARISKDMAFPHHFECMECGCKTPMPSEPPCIVEGCGKESTSGHRGERYCGDHMHIGLMKFVGRCFRN